MASQLESIESEIGTVCLFDTTNILSVSDSYRILRNSVASNEKFARLIVEDDRNLIKTASDVFRKLADVDDDDDAALGLKRIVLQFVGNLVSRIPEAKFTVFNEFRPFFGDLLNHTDTKIVSYGSMVLFNCLDRLSIEKFCSDDDDNGDESAKLLKKIYTLVKTGDDVEWCLFVIERFLIDGENFFHSFWTRLSTDDQIFTIEICLSMMEKDEKQYLHESNMNILVDVFVQLSNLLVTNEDSSKFDESQFCFVSPLFTLILSLFCKLTVDSNVDAYDQNRFGSRILESTLKLLKRIQRLCREGHSFFAIEKCTKSFSDGCDHPTTGLKRDLVNLTANLCYRSSERQNLARQMDAVPLILDCTMMDARNHFITQWAILALRNLLEDCPENQRVVAMLNPESVVENSELLNELRLEPYLDERGRIKLKTKPFQ